MSTVAVRNGVIAADTMSTDGELKFPTKKLFIVKKKRVVIGISGDVGSCMRFLDWYQDRRKSMRIDDSDDFECIVAGLDRIETWDNNLRPTVIDSPFYAVGHGAAVALGAMEVGAGAKQAVAAACKWDLYTNGPVDEIHLRILTGP